MESGMGDREPRKKVQRVKRRFLKKPPLTALLTHQFFEYASDAVLIIDQRGLIIQLNGQTEQLFGYRRDELINQPIETLVPERLRDRHIEHRRLYFRNPRPTAMGNVCGRFGLRKDGTEFPIDIALSPLPTKLGLFVASAVRDRTRQCELEDELRRRARELEEADRQKDQFLAMLAHELSSPLAAIAYSVETLRRAIDTHETRKEAAQVVLDETNLMQRLVSDLGELSHIRNGNVVLRPEPMNLAQVAYLALEIVHPLIERRGHSVELVKPSSALHVRGDRARLVQIVANLLANAARYTPDGGHIQLSIAQDDGAVILKVSDDGIGIPTAMLTEVFMPFVRLRSAQKEHGGGLGIGLALVRRLVEIQEGTVEAFSAGEGQGSQFIVRLPLLRAAQNVAPRQATKNLAG